MSRSRYLLFFLATSFFSWLLVLPAHPGTTSSRPGVLGTEQAVPLPAGSILLQSVSALSFVNNIFTPSWRRVSAGGDFQNFSQLLKVAYGIGSGAEVLAMFNCYTHNWASQVTEPGPQGERAADFGGVGNLLLGGKYLLKPESTGTPAVSAFLAAILPTAHFRRLNPSKLFMDQLGEGGYQVMAGLNLQKDFPPLTIYGNVWYAISTDYTADKFTAEGEQEQFRFHPRDTVLLNVAAECPVSSRWLVSLELVSAWDGGRLIGARANIVPAAYVTISPGVTFIATERLFLGLGVALDLFGKNTFATVGPYASAAYVF